MVATGSIERREKAIGLRARIGSSQVSNTRQWDKGFGPKPAVSELAHAERVEQLDPFVSIALVLEIPEANLGEIGAVG